MVGAVSGDRRCPSQLGEGREIASGLDLVAGEHVVPDRPDRLPGPAAGRGSSHREGPVRDPGVEMHPAVVVVGGDEAVHVVGLRVSAQARVVVRGAGA